MMSWPLGGMEPLGWLVMVVFWLTLLALIVWLVGRLLPGSSADSTQSPSESALEALDRRLASGEIDLQDWQVHRNALLSGQGDRT